ncbi:MAG: arsenate reductase [Alphaproteobacteria bacterium]|nr:MAG: arsenate reductase [Alphaproteobacteria bacterium]
MIKVFGLKNCDTVRKALKWLDARGVAHQFHDFRKDGLARDQLESWAKELGSDILLNRRGTTWRKLPDDQKENLTEAAIIDLLLTHPAMIKRPLFDFGRFCRVGFSKKDQEEIAALLDGDIT